MSEHSQEYPWIRKWNAYLGGQPYYARDETERARRDAAPADAIYWCFTERRWMTLADITNPMALLALGVRR